MNWKEGLRTAIRTKAQLKNRLQLVPEEERALDQLSGLPLLITEHYLGLMDAQNPNDPLRLQVVPRIWEQQTDANLRRDPLGEEDHEVVPHLVHRYPDRVLFLVTDRCASYCRFCTRKRWVGQGPTPQLQHLEKALEYIQTHPAIKEVILSGGDALIWDDTKLQWMLEKLRAISHIQIIRIASRMLAFLPKRITPELLSILKAHKPIYLMSHFNHPHEVDEKASLALDQLADHGVVVMNQTVLLKGINDHPKTLEALFRKLVYHRARPYYLHQCDVIQGSSHFRVPINDALELMHQLRGHVSGLCLPTFVIDIPGGYGKVPLYKSSIIRSDKTHLSLVGFAGEVGEYPLV